MECGADGVLCLSELFLADDDGEVCR